ncbi:MAG: diguanylate cyclase [Gemmatimonadaceae bacterium]|nr:diguanylate cyclase [Gemmatimonadaceae bacterium]
MDVQLWRWSTAVQVTSALLIALFFLVLAHSTRRAELRVWVVAWVANLLALGVTLAFWMPAAQTEALLVMMRLPYLVCKLAFVVLLVIGAVNFGRPAPSPERLFRIGVVILGVSIAMSLVADSLDIIGVLIHASIALVLGSTAVWMAMQHMPVGGWLVAGFALRGGLAGLECIAFASRLVNGTAVAGEGVTTFVAMSSAFDAGAEWLIALGCVLAVYQTMGRELTRINEDLVATKDELRVLSHRDPLTGVFNRRRLDDIMHDSQQTGATILFFDLDDFKDINDHHGHHVGDEALQLFARVLQSSFRPGDHVVRYAGDEFIVVGQGIEQLDVGARITLVRETLVQHRAEGPCIRFAVGEAYLPVGGDPDAALRAADAAMYQRKGEQKRMA